jgi:hypothetical protein
MPFCRGMQRPQARRRTAHLLRAVMGAIVPLRFGAPKGWRQRTPHCNPATFVRSAAVEKCTASKSRPRW